MHRDSILFWDTVQFTSKHGTWFYDNGIFSMLPMQLDSGHPPVFGMYQAVMWKIFGQSLRVSHLSMLPFIYVMIWYATKLGELYTKATPWLYPIALLLCPFVLGHLVLVSPDIVLMAAFLMALYSLLAFRHIPLILSSVVLALISMRGFAMMSGLALFQAIVLGQKGDRVKPIFMKLFRIYFFPVALFLAYQSWHMMTQDWVGFHSDSPWSTSFNKASGRGLIKNIVVFIWRLLDYGMIVPYTIALFGIAQLRSDKHRLLPLLLILLGLLFLIIIPFNGLMNHRYFLPIQAILLLMAAGVVSNYEGINKKIGIVALIGCMALGNLIIYPENTAQGWDSTAAHWPIYGLYEEMSHYIDTETQISKSQVGTAFPFRSAEHYLELNNQDLGYHQYNMQKDKYILRSNVMNEFSDEQILALDKWVVVKSFNRHGVHLTLYRSQH